MIGLVAVLLVVVVIAVRPLIQGGGSRQTDVRPETDHTVTIDVIGMKADVYRDGQRLGSTPYSLPVRLGDHVELILRRDGYYDKEMVFDVTASRKDYTETLQRR